LQTADIDLSAASPAINTWDSNQGWTPVGNASTKFIGSYDGQNYSIIGLYIDRQSSDYIGLFGYLDNASISNLGLASGSVKGNNPVGGLAGAVYGSGTVTKCYNKCSVSGSSEVGGLVGRNFDGTISLSYNTGTIGNGIITTSGSAYVGGLVGHNDIGSIVNSYSTGMIDGGYWGVGGLVGYNNTNGGNVNNCYSIGQVNAYPNPDPSYGLYRYGGLVGDCCSGPVYNSYWDTQASGTSMSPSGQGTGLTTSQMKTQSSFSDWNFSTTWAINSSLNSGYPYLQWAVGVDQSLPVELTAFTTAYQSGTVILSWTTESETENMGFIIERKIGGAIHESPSDWSQIASYVSEKNLTGHGSTSEKHDYQYTDKAIQTGATYLYRMADVDYSGAVTWHKEVEVKVEAGKSQMPAQFVFLIAYPNPFNPAVMLRYHLSESCNAVLRIFDLEGRIIETVVNSYQPVGTFSLVWRPVNQGAGIYILQLQAGKSTQTQKILYVK